MKEVKELTDYQKGFIKGYIECMLWSTTYCGYDIDPDNNVDSSFQDLGYNASHLTDDAKRSIQDDCLAFIETCQDLLKEWPHDAEHAGHDFFLTRCGHGAGYWDRFNRHIEDQKILAQIGEDLTVIARPYGDVNLYLNPNEEIEIY